MYIQEIVLLYQNNRFFSVFHIIYMGSIESGTHKIRRRGRFFFSLNASVTVASPAPGHNLCFVDTALSYSCCFLLFWAPAVLRLPLILRSPLCCAPASERAVAKPTTPGYTGRRKRCANPTSGPDTLSWGETQDRQMTTNTTCIMIWDFCHSALHSPIYSYLPKGAARGLGPTGRLIGAP